MDYKQHESTNQSTSLTSCRFLMVLIFYCQSCRYEPLVLSVIDHYAASFHMIKHEQILTITNPTWMVSSQYWPLRLPFTGRGSTVPRSQLGAQSSSRGAVQTVPLKMKSTLCDRFKLTPGGWEAAAHQVEHDGWWRLVVSWWSMVDPMQWWVIAVNFMVVDSGK